MAQCPIPHGSQRKDGYRVDQGGKVRLGIDAVIMVIMVMMMMVMMEGRLLGHERNEETASLKCK